MDRLRATYTEDDDEDNSSNNTNNSGDNGITDPTQLTSIMDGGANVATITTTTTTTTSTTSATPDTETEPLHGIKEEPIASEDLSDIEPKDSPNFTKISSDDEEEEEEEEEEQEEEEEEEDRPPKKQKQLSSLAPQIPTTEELLSEELVATTLPQPTTKLRAIATTAKKSKKKSKSNNVWTKPTSRKGKKKTKSSTNNNAQTQDAVLVTPIPRFPDKNDDSTEMRICLSKVYKAEKVELSDDRLSASSCKGYRMVKATRGVMEGAWYFEIKVVKLGETGHSRLGWSTEKGDLQAPVGYDGNSFGYRDIDGSKLHKALREKYGEEGYVEGDIIGFYIYLPEGNLYAPKPQHLVLYKGQRYVCAPDAKEDPPKVVPGSQISFFRNGLCQGVAFKDLYGGRYYPAASMYTLPNQPNCIVRFNFGPDFEVFPEDFGGRPVPRPMVEVPYHGFDGRVENGVSNEKKH